MCVREVVNLANCQILLVEIAKKSCRDCRKRYSDEEISSPH